MATYQTEEDMVRDEVQKRIRDEILKWQAQLQQHNSHAPPDRAKQHFSAFTAPVSSALYLRALRSPVPTALHDCGTPWKMPT
jgi:hypothetical protein